MSDPEKLGGFKVLKEAVLFSPASFEPDGRLPAALFRILAEHEINLPYVTCVQEKPGRWQIDTAVDFKDARTAGRLLSEILGKRPARQSNVAILSIFPHRKKPAITGAVFEAFVRKGIHPRP